jgi:hypothetical protein
MFSCCGSRQKSTAAGASQLNPNRQTSSNRDANMTSNPEEVGQEALDERIDKMADSSTSAADTNSQEHRQFEPLSEEFDLNSSIFMPDPSKRRPSAFEMASASYAEATDFNAKDQLASMSELAEEEDESHSARGTRGKENEKAQAHIGNS